MKELELYIHIPFCVRKCAYCDFLSAPAAAETRQAYLEQLIREITAASGACRDYQIQTVFVGGGTPSLLSAEEILYLFEAIRTGFSVHAQAEITIECNPGTLDAGKLQAYRKAGINRLSIGLQSADLQELKLLGRIHTFGQFASNYATARELGFENINVDIMSALPGQTISTYEQTLQRVLALRPEHISAYSLIIEEGTSFFEQYGQADFLRSQDRPQHLLPSEEEERRMYQLTKELLKSAGYERYEISNYALDGYACRHNLGYWTRREYLGLGLGAASLLRETRFSNPADLHTYLALDFAEMAAGLPWQEQREYLDKQAQMEEFMFLGLRLMRGISAKKFYECFSRTLEDVYGEVLDKQLNEGLIKKTQTGYCLTAYGTDVSNYVMAGYMI